MFSSAAGCSSRSAGRIVARIRPRADASLVASSRQCSPRARQYAAVSSRVISSSGRITSPLRACMPSSARRPGEAASR